MIRLILYYEADISDSFRHVCLLRKQVATFLKEGGL